MKKGTSQPPLPHTHTHLWGWGGPGFWALPTLLIPTFSDAPKAGTCRPPRVGAICPMPAWNEGRGPSALHEPHCGSSTSTGVGTSSLRTWLQTNKHTGRQDYQYQPLSPTAVGPSQSREVHSYLVMCPVTIQSTPHVFWNMKGRLSFSAVVMNLALGLRLGAVSPKVLAALRDGLVSLNGNRAEGVHHADPDIPFSFFVRPQENPTHTHTPTSSSSFILSFFDDDDLSFFYLSFLLLL